jgi:urease accessory protein UreF
MLQKERTQVISEAVLGLSRATLPHYAAGDAEQNTQRLAKLYDLTEECVRARTLVPIVSYARSLAGDRHKDGFGFQEVHTAINALEEAIWRTITAKLDPVHYPEAFGLVSTVLGAGKQALAIEWISLASESRHVQSLDLSALFRGAP